MQKTELVDVRIDPACLATELHVCRDETARRVAEDLLKSPGVRPSNSRVGHTAVEGLVDTWSIRALPRSWRTRPLYGCSEALAEMKKLDPDSRLFQHVLENDDWLGLFWTRAEVDGLVGFVVVERSNVTS